MNQEDCCGLKGAVYSEYQPHWDYRARPCLVSEYKHQTDKDGIRYKCYFIPYGIGYKQSYKQREINANSGSWKSFRGWRAPGHIWKLQFLAAVVTTTTDWRGDHSIASAGFWCHQIHLENYPRASHSLILNHKGLWFLNYTEFISNVARRKCNSIFTQLYREDKLLATEATGEKNVIRKTDMPEYQKNERKITQPKAMG